MVDLTQIFIKAGNGGDGRISFLRNRLQPKGGPDGGDGGKGGSVIAQGNIHMHSLRDFAGRHSIAAIDGKMGGKDKRHGANAEDVVFQLPVGTLIWKLPNEYKVAGKRMYWIDDEGHRRERYLVRGQKLSKKGPFAPLHHSPVVVEESESEINEKTQTSQSYMPEPDFRKTAILVGEITKQGQLLRIARSGTGGRGNWQFRSSTHTTPMEAETGSEGEYGVFVFELQVLADVGLVGFPNVGKSTLLSSLTQARPEIADYAFTTLVPNLGVMQFTSTRESDRSSLIIADIPGIIEGANEGKGLGVDFLRHIERTRILIFVLSLDQYDVLEGLHTPEELANALVVQYKALESELNQYEEKTKEVVQSAKREPLSSKPRALLINKTDLYSDAIIAAIKKKFKSYKAMPIFFMSAKTMIGTQEFKEYLQSL